MRLVGGDRPSAFVGEHWMLAVAAGADVVVVEQFVVPGTEQDEVVDLRFPSQLERDDMVRFELADRSAAGVLALPL